MNAPMVDGPIKYPAEPVWWAVVLRGIVLMILGTYLMLFPAGTLLVLAQILSVYLIADGLVRLLTAILVESSESRGLNILTAILGILIGAMVFGAPVAGLAVTTSLVIIALYTIGLFTVVVGVAALVTAFTRRGSGKRLMLFAGAVLGVIFGLALLGAPTLGVSVLLVSSIGILALVYGGTLVWDGLAARRSKS